MTQALGAELRVLRADPLESAIAALLARHKTFSSGLAPACSEHSLEAEELAAPDVDFLAAYRGDDLLGCGALRQMQPGHGEIKSMHVIEAARGQGVAQMVLAHLLDQGAAQGIRTFWLETGSANGFAPARRLYERAGFAICPPFGDYVEDPHSVYMVRRIGGG